jgi:SAM-dependent methyltransferase
VEATPDDFGIASVGSLRYRARTTELTGGLGLAKRPSLEGSDASYRRQAVRTARAAAKAIDSVPIVRELALPLLFVVLWIVLNKWLGLTGRHEPSEIFGGVVAAVLGYATATLLRMRGFVKSIGLIRQIADSSAHSAGRSLYVQMVHDQVKAARRIVDGFQHDTYVANSPEEFQSWIGAFFRLGRGPYIAVDSHPPSRYWSDYEWFLDAHSSSLDDRREKGEHVTGDVRVLSITREDLDDDFFEDDRAEDYQRFVSWHDKNKVTLRVIEPPKLQEIRHAHNLDTTEDIGLWQGLATLFTPADKRDGNRVGIKIRVRRDDNVEPSYDTISKVMTAVVGHSELLTDAAPGVEMGDDKLIERWNDYLGPQLRWTAGGKFEQFITRVLPSGGSVFDSAAGTGVDSVNLLLRGYSVTSNEVDHRLRQVARDFAQEHHVEMELKSLRWEQLVLPGNPKFDSILVLGNSLCLVSSSERRRRALNAFCALLKPGGELVIDERNYEYMRAHRAEILADPYKNWLSSRVDVMYPSTDMLGYPSAIGDDSVEWRFVDNTPEIRDKGDVSRRSSKYAPLHLYAFQKGQLVRELQSAGFAVVDQYADLEPLRVDDEGVADASTDDAGFFTYIARKDP